MVRRKRQPKIGECALCGLTDIVTREHVPPKNLFLKPRPTNTITVPLCKNCNHSYCLDDEYFRVFIAADYSPTTKQWRLWQEKVVGSSFTRGGGLRGRLNDEYNSLLANIKSNPTNSTIPSEMLPFIQPFNLERINAVVKKVVRCLYFKHFGNVLSQDAIIDINAEDATSLTEEELRKVAFEHKGFVGKNGEEFIYWFDSSKKNGYVDWILLFYLSKSFKISVIEITKNPDHKGRI